MKTVLITGGSRGIGLEIAKKYNKLGYNVVTTSTSNWVNKSFSPKEHIIVDFLNSIEMERFLKKIRKLSIDILINNAGVNKIDPFIKIKPHDFSIIQSVNVFAPFRICQMVLPNMISKKWGRIINISSIWGLKSKEFRGSYSSSKFAIDGMTKSLAIEHGKINILTNSVSPGFIDTELTRKVLSKKDIESLIKRVPCNRLGQPEEIASFVFWLGSEMNTFINGQNIPIDGGFTIG